LANEITGSVPTGEGGNMNQVIIADDEPLLRFHLQKSLAEVWPEAEVLAQAANGEEAFSLVQELQPDVIFLDIHMPGLTGLEVALKMSQLKLNTKVVFLTAYDEYAVQAFEQGAVDYLLKPLDEARLQKTVERLLQNAPQQTNDALDVDLLLDLVSASSPDKHLTWLNAQQGDSVKVVHVDDVLYFKAEDKYTTLVSLEGEYLLRLSIKQLEEQLDQKIYWRIHRGTLVNMRHVDRVEKTMSGHLQLFLKGVKQPLQVSRAKQNLFKAH
jgi:DNA-binding LytR/AlgR family response regulator